MYLKIASVLPAVFLLFTGGCAVDDVELDTGLSAESGIFWGEAPVEIWFSRHAEDTTAIVENDDGSIAYDCNDAGCCIEPLNALGMERANQLAAFLEHHRVLNRVDYVLASHKSRTQQTAGPSSMAIGVDLTVLPDEEECAPGFEKGSPSTQPMIDFIDNMPGGSTALVVGHSGTVYKIMEAFGIDTSDPDVFPKNAKGNIDGFENLWQVVIVNDMAWVRRHLVLSFALRPQWFSAR